MRAGPSLFPRVDPRTSSGPWLVESSPLHPFPALSFFSSFFSLYIQSSLIIQLLLFVPVLEK